MWRGGTDNSHVTDTSSAIFTTRRIEFILQHLYFPREGHRIRPAYLVPFPLYSLDSLTSAKLDNAEIMERQT